MIELTQCSSFCSVGPNATTFITPGEVFPTRYRATCHGLSAGAGKIGAIIAQVGIGPLIHHGAPSNCTGSACSPWLDHVMQIFALLMLCGGIVSLLIPESKRISLEKLAGEELPPSGRELHDFRRQHRSRNKPLPVARDYTFFWE
jgi:PHS family inorganic phosphate transporter-like MFS transporter